MGTVLGFLSRRSGARLQWRWVGWLGLILGACAAGEVAEPILPAPHLLVPLLAGLALAVSGLTADQVPGRLNRGCQAVLGVLMGGYLDPHTAHQAAAEVLPLAAVTTVTIGLSLAAAAIMARTGRIDRASATLGMVAGGSAAVISSAADFDADPRIVAFLQYLRVALVATTAPVLVHWLLAPHPAAGTAAVAHPSAWSLVTGGDQGIGLVLLAAVALTGTLTGRGLRLPSPALLGPMLLTAAITASGALSGFTPTGPLRTAVFTIVGLDIGLRFTRPTLAHMRRLLPLALACTMSIMAVCAVLAWLLSVMAHIPFTDAYLATTPGGVNAVLTTAAATHADVSLISSVQSLRLFAMVLLAPLFIRLTISRPPRPGPTTGHRHAGNRRTGGSGRPTG
ncbi:AbrB family transcriptional regulator [Sphaerisporangium sp. NPDC005289]|uniref:AbrB family transcriptional regulator n=1 Tax=Sphaerisporangium sp. NPDC005289 TaxID=3155247 RepID=UPI0033B1FC4F